MTWPPPDRELDHYDVVDVRDGARTAVHAATATPSTAADAAPASATMPPADAAGFARPDWSELRLRAPGDEPPHRSPWLWVITSLLALATVGQAAYIWQVQATRPAQEKRPSAGRRPRGRGGARERPGHRCGARRSRARSWHLRGRGGPARGQCPRRRRDHSALVAPSCSCSRPRRRWPHRRLPPPFLRVGRSSSHPRPASPPCRRRRRPPGVW